MSLQASIGIQLFCVRGECGRDLPATLATVAQMGYRGAEPWGYRGEALEWMGQPAAQIRRMYDDHGLTCCGIHLATAALAENLPRTIDFCHALGCRFLVIAADRQRMGSMAGIEQLAGILNVAVEELDAHGMACGYHAHGFDFARIEGQVAWDALFSRTHPQVIMQLDIGNCAGGGGDPVATLKRFPGRARSVHLKEHGGAEDAAIGEGGIDWGAVFTACGEHQPVEWYVVEQGSDDGTGFDIPRRSLEALARMGITGGEARPRTP